MVTAWAEFAILGARFQENDFAGFTSTTCPENYSECGIYGHE